jgi:hypothetical protein
MRPLGVDREASSEAIGQQRERLLRVQAIAGALGMALDEECGGVEMEYVTHAIIALLDDTMPSLERAVLCGEVSNSPICRAS